MESLQRSKCLIRRTVINVWAQIDSITVGSTSQSKVGQIEVAVDKLLMQRTEFSRITDLILRAMDDTEKSNKEESEMEERYVIEADEDRKLVHSSTTKLKRDCRQRRRPIVY